MIILTETRKITVDVNHRGQDGWMTDMACEDYMGLSQYEYDEDKSDELGDKVYRMTDAEANELYEYVRSEIECAEEAQAECAREAAETDDAEEKDLIWSNIAANTKTEAFPELKEGEEYWWSWDEEDYDPKEDEEEDEETTED